MHSFGKRQMTSRVVRALVPACVAVVLVATVGCGVDQATLDKARQQTETLQSKVFMLSMALAGSVLLSIVFFLVGTAFGSAARRDAERTGGGSRRQHDGR
jgi:hypothetical protein